MPVEGNTRIMYVEPNYVYGVTDDKGNVIQELSIPYEDLCISFNLTVQNFSRFTENKGGATNSRQQDITISWDLDNSNQASLLRGDDYNMSQLTDEEAPRYLTTYYTDISFENYGTKKIVEGLGVLSVEVSWESWYTPTVVIKFVDVRGSALWGNEEAIHDEYGKVTADNIFGAFFTIPYPMFRLQMKGFLGKPVTFQLTLTDFRGEYNSTDGNFQATATFIGYSYALLTDIPLAYIMAAPYCKYEGKQYWEKHCTDEDWLLYDNVQPPKLVDFFQKVRAAKPDESDTNESIKEEESEKLSNLATKRNSLLGLINNFNDFIKELKAIFPTHFLDSEYRDENGKRQILLMCEGSGDTITKSINNNTKQAYQKLISSLDTHNSRFSDCKVNKSKLPNNWNNQCPNEITLRKAFLVSGDKKIVNIYRPNNANYISIRTLQLINFSNNKKLDNFLANRICRICSNRSDIKNVMADYGYIVEDSFVSQINSIVDKLQAEEKKIKNNVAIRSAERVEKYLPFKPYIGNFFKVLMCHLETFIHIMFTAYEEIKTESEKNQRTPARLGITLESTDIPTDSVDYITSWPKVVNHGIKTSEGGDIDTARNSIGWVGDFSHNFVEEKVVLAIEAAIRYIDIQLVTIPEVIPLEKRQETPFPLVPHDYNVNESAFQYVAENLNLSSFAGYLTIRAFQVLGIKYVTEAIQGEYAKTLGKIDAYNFYYCARKDIIKEKILDKIRGDKGDTIIGIAICDPQYDNFGSLDEQSHQTCQDFENNCTDYTEGRRHPIMVESDDSYVFAHYYTNYLEDSRRLSLIPSDFRKWEEYNDIFQIIRREGESSYYYGIYEEGLQNNSGEWVHAANSAVIAHVNNSTSYINESMFRIITDSNVVNSFIDKVINIKDGAYTVNDVDVDDIKIKDLISHDWFVTDEYYYRFFQYSILTKKREELGINTSMLIPMDWSDSDNVDIDYNSTNNYKLRNAKHALGSDNGFKFDGEEDVYDIDNLVIPSFTIFDNGCEGCLFGSVFYYLQYDQTNVDLKNKVKAYLLLHSLNYLISYRNIIKLGCFNRKNDIEVVPYGYILFLGGLLWRNRQSQDPIISQNGYYNIVYKNIDKSHSLLVKETNSNVINFKVSCSDTYDYLSLDDFGLDDVDYNLQNQFIKLFEEFAEGDICKKIIEELEIREVSYNFHVQVSRRIFDKGIGAYELQCFMNSIWTNYINDDYKKLKRYFKVKNNVYRMVSRKHLNNNESRYCLWMLIDENLVSLKNIKEIYTRKCLVIQGCGYNLTADYSTDDDDEVKIKKNYLKDYVSSFMATLENIVKDDNDEDDNSSPAGDGELNENRDICINIYTYCKNLWDKWLTPLKDNKEKQSQYDVKNFFLKNFVFMDTYYCNVYDKLPLNATTLLELEEGLNESGMLMGYMDQVISKHHCMFFSVPDFVGIANNSREEGWSNIKDMFKAMPYNNMLQALGGTDIGKPDNKFIIIYVDPSTMTSTNNNNNFTSDSFDVWNSEKKDAIAPDIFKVKNTNDENNDYYIPTFGVAVNRQNNHIFKGIKVSMNNPVMTEQAAKALENAYKKGGEGERVIIFHGQDIYNIYSSYSYICDVEMLGNAQIWPMMYFQLLNIPMWRGTYMIYKVKHSMTPGNMITTFSGMKLTKTPTNMAQTFYSIRGPYSDSSNNTIFEGYGSGPYADMQSNYQSAVAIGKYFDDSKNWATNRYSSEQIKVVPSLKSLYDNLFVEIKLLHENGNKNENDTPADGDWNIMLYDANSSRPRTSDHWRNNGNEIHSCAMDLHPMIYNGGEWKEVTSGQDRKQLFTVLDLIYCNHRREVRQVIIEYQNREDMDVPTQYNKILCLHVAVKHDNDSVGDTKNEFFIADASNGYNRINQGVTDKQWFLSHVPNEFRYSAYRCYTSDRNNFTTRFTNYAYYTIGSEELSLHFGNLLYPNGTVSGGDNNISTVYTLLKSTHGFSEISAVAICANMMRESELDPKACNDECKAIGLCQWRNSRQNIIINYLMDIDHTCGSSSIKDYDLTSQVAAAVKEMGDGTEKILETYDSSKPTVYDYFKENGKYLNDETYKGYNSKINKAEYLANVFMMSYERPGDNYDYKSTNTANILKIVEKMQLTGY